MRLYDIISPNEILFGNYGEDGYTYGEMTMEWHLIFGREPTPRLQVFDDGWAALFLSMTDVMRELAYVNGENCSPEQFVEILRDCGFSNRKAGL